MAERRLRYGLIWTALIGLLLAAAALITSPDGGRQAIGLALLLTPLVVFGLVQAAYYVKMRMDAGRD